MSAHTPGPWNADITNAPEIWITAYQPAWRSHPAGVRPIPCDMRQESGEANARLIAASPMGYDLAKSVLAWWNQHQWYAQPCVDDDEPEFVELAKQFIAKAEGKS